MTIPPEHIEAVARALRELMGPLFGSPEYLADPINRARSEKQQADAALSQAQAAITALQALGYRYVGSTQTVAPLSATETQRLAGYKPLLKFMNADEIDQDSKAALTEIYRAMITAHQKEGGE